MYIIVLSDKNKKNPEIPKKKTDLFQKSLGIRIYIEVMLGGAVVKFLKFLMVFFLSSYCINFIFAAN